MAIPPFIIDKSYSEAAKALSVKELRETPDVVQKGITDLKNLLKQNPDLHYGDSDEILTIYLKPCKYYAESALKLMRQIAEFRKTNHSLLDDLLPASEKEALTEYNVVNVMKNRDHLGRKVLIVNSGGSWNPSKVSADQIFRIFYIMHEIAVLEPDTQSNGIVVILDFDDMGMKQATAFSPSVSKRLLTFIQKAMPMRLKEVHIVKEPGIFSIVWAIFKPFIEEKLKKRIFFHGKKMESLHKHLNPSHLPKNYGGELPEIDYGSANWYPALEEHTEHVKKMNTYGFKK